MSLKYEPASEPLHICCSQIEKCTGTCISPCGRFLAVCLPPFSAPPQGAAPVPDAAPPAGFFFFFVITLFLLVRYYFFFFFVITLCFFVITLFFFVITLSSSSFSLLLSSLEFSDTHVYAPLPRPLLLPTPHRQQAHPKPRIFFFFVIDASLDALSLLSDVISSIKILCEESPARRNRLPPALLCPARPFSRRRTASRQTRNILCRV